MYSKSVQFACSPVFSFILYFICFTVHQHASVVGFTSPMILSRNRLFGTGFYPELLSGIHFLLKNKNKEKNQMKLPEVQVKRLQILFLQLIVEKLDQIKHDSGLRCNVVKPVGDGAVSQHV